MNWWLRWLYHLTPVPELTKALVAEWDQIFPTFVENYLRAVEAVYSSRLMRKFLLS